MSGVTGLTFLQKTGRALPLALAFAATLPFALFFMALVAGYWGYFDMGINSAANGLVLLLCYGPVALVLLLATTTAVIFALRSRVGGWLTLLVTLGAMALLVSGLFAAEAHRTRDYPGLRQQKSMGEFLGWFVQNWFSPRRNTA